MRLRVTSNIMRSFSFSEINYYKTSNENTVTVRHLLDVISGYYTTQSNEFLIVPVASGPPMMPNYCPAFFPVQHLPQNPASLKKMKQEMAPNQETNPVVESNSNV
ncbi:hypothetical protein L5515_017374 [Caenorhabditis briggsae]|uniref:Uncharacterized protein n=1 Tax=Caenorhabditis briggsae TaxID=6238 RepID=A0AAE9FGQ8_CAEBR|nr:hypothetical protein L5515_017374 [Caenorhabditis briggsae]